MNRVVVDVADSLGHREDRSRSDDAGGKDDIVRAAVVEDIVGIFHANTRYEAHVSPEVLCQRLTITAGNLIRMLKVKADEILRNLAPLMLVCLEEGPVGVHEPAKRKVELPAQVPGVVDARVHALCRLGRVGVARVAGDEGAAVVVCESRGHALADVVAAGPLDRGPVQVVRGADELGASHDGLDVDGLDACFWWAALGLELDVETRHAALTGDDEDGAVARMHDDGLGPDVREVTPDDAV